MKTILIIVLGVIVISVAVAILKGLLYLAANALGSILGFLFYYLTHYWILPVITGLLSWWWFDLPWLGAIVGLVICLILRSDSESGSHDSSSHYKGYSGSSYSTRLTSSNSSSYSPRYDDSDSDDKRSEYYELYARQANEALSQYNYYKSKAAETIRQAEIYRRYAESYERSGREHGDEMDLNYARENYERAESELSDAQDYLREADRYYDDYQYNKSQAESYR